MARPRPRSRLRQGGTTTPQARQRRIVSRGFTPAKVRALTDHIRDLSNQIIDEVAQRGELDVVEEFAIHVPLIVIAEMMGLDDLLPHGHPGPHVQRRRPQGRAEGLGFPELAGDPTAIARVIRGQVFALVVEHLALGAVTPAIARERAPELATVIFP